MAETEIKLEEIRNAVEWAFNVACEAPGLTRQQRARYSMLFDTAVSLMDEGLKAKTQPQAAKPETEAAKPEPKAKKAKEAAKEAAKPEST